MNSPPPNQISQRSKSSLKRFLARWFGSSVPSRLPSASPTFRPSLEQLDDRITPSVTAMADSATVLHDSIYNGASVLANDTGSGPLTAQLVTMPQHGSVMVMSDGSYSYSPGIGYIGADQFTYQATVGSESATAIVSLTVYDNAPSASSFSTTISSQNMMPNINVLSHTSDPDNETLTVILVNGPMHGTAWVNFDGTIACMLNSGYVGADSLSFKVTDHALESNTATVSITVTGTGPAPVANDDAFSFAPGSMPSQLSLDVLANDTNAAGSTLMPTIVQSPLHGSAYVSGGTIWYTPNSGFAGSDMLTYQDFDGTQPSNVATVTINQGPVVVQNAGNGHIKLSWIGSAGVVSLSPQQTAYIDPPTGVFSVALVTEGATYNLATNGTVGSISAYLTAVPITTVQLSVDTTQSLGHGFVGTGDVSGVTIPGGTISGRSTLGINARGDLGIVVGNAAMSMAGYGVDAQGLDFSFNNLTGLITGINHIDHLNASAWLGIIPSSAVTVDHGVDYLTALGIGATVDTNAQYDPNDPSGTVSIGAGGILQAVSLGNVSDFLDAGNINTLLIADLGGMLTINGAQSVSLLQIGVAQDAGIQAPATTLDRLYMQPTRPNQSRTLEADSQVYAMGFSRPVTFGAIGTFEVGGTINNMTGLPNRYRLNFVHNLRINGNIDQFKVVGNIRANNIYIGGTVTNVDVTGFPGTSRRFGADWDYAIQTDYFVINNFPSMLTGNERFIAGRSVAVNQFIVSNGNLPELIVRGTGAFAGDFIGSIKVPNGSIDSITVSGTIALPNFPQDDILIEASGSIESITAKIIGSNPANSSIIIAQSFGTINARREEGDTTVGAIAIWATIYASDGNIQTIDATDGTIYGDIILYAGNVVNPILGTLRGRVIEN